MSQSSKQHFAQQLTQLQFDNEPQNCWHNIQRGLAAVCQEAFSPETDQPFDYWWHKSFELLSGRQICISHIHFDGKEQDEYIELSNKGPAIIDLSGWRLNAGNDGQDFTFAHASLIQPKQNIKIYTKQNEGYSFNSKRPIWNNKGDTGLLFDTKGELISSRVYGNKAHSEVAISHIEYDGVQKRTEGDEFIEIANLGRHRVDIGGWAISAGNKQDFHFPQRATINPFASVRVYTNMHHPQTGGFSFDSPRAIWNNKGDKGQLLDQNGIQVSEYRYGSL